MSVTSRPPEGKPVPPTSDPGPVHPITALLLAASLGALTGLLVDWPTGATVLAAVIGLFEARRQI
ncbi:hypothetical protein [Nocardia brasiliensis]|uniref:hypothetical protein n=1 Tax=Nocardia brasiliensis TaxID=37326 RepID=UPI002457128E|nr:hypothetical protein [Nocardia brasiliensis]